MKIKRAVFGSAVKCGDDLRHEVDSERHGVEMPVLVTPGGTEYVRVEGRCYPLASLQYWEPCEEPVPAKGK